jgi:hypothetical protein
VLATSLWRLPSILRYEANADVNFFLFCFLGSEVGAVSGGDGRL